MNKATINNKLVMALSNTHNWKPNFTKIHRETGVPIATIHDNYHKVLYKYFTFKVEEKSLTDVAKEDQNGQGRIPEGTEEAQG